MSDQFVIMFWFPIHTNIQICLIMVNDIGEDTNLLPEAKRVFRSCRTDEQLSAHVGKYCCSETHSNCTTPFRLEQIWVEPTYPEYVPGRGGHEDEGASCLDQLI